MDGDREALILEALAWADAHRWTANSIIHRLCDALAQPPIIPTRGVGEDHPKSSADFHQRQGRFADIIREALSAFDEWMLDDDYDAQGCLERIINRMRERSAPPYPSFVPTPPTQDRFGPFVPCPHCGGELDTEDPTGHRMIFRPGWTHHGEPDWECLPAPPTRKAT